MMKKLFNKLFIKKINCKSSQQDLIDYVTNPDNLKKAAEGSMQKRIDLINRVELSQNNYSEA